MKSKAIASSPEYFHQYINLVEEGNFIELLETGGIEPFIESLDQLEKIGSDTYATGKWTISQILEHLIDTERIFVNRALRFVRNDKTELPSFDENLFADNSRSGDRTIEDLLEEYQLVRLSTFAFFKHLNEEELMREGVAGGNRISVLAIGYCLIGHPLHHMNVIESRYFSLN